MIDFVRALVEARTGFALPGISNGLVGAGEIPGFSFAETPGLLWLLARDFWYEFSIVVNLPIEPGNVCWIVGYGAAKVTCGAVGTI